MKKNKIEITNFLGGFAPGWWLDNYTSYGNRNMAGDMQNVDLMCPSYLTQGPGLLQMTPTAAVTSEIYSILDRAISSGITYGVGGNKFYEILPSSVGTASTPALPHTVTGTSVYLQDLAYYGGNIYYSYYTTLSANVGRYDCTRDAETDFDDDWATVSASAVISSGAPLPLESAGNDTLYLGNADRISSYDTLAGWTKTALDLPTNCEVQDIKWNANKLYISANKPDIGGTNRSFGSIFEWDGDSASWDYETLIGGRVGALFVNNGITYVFYQDITDTGGYKLGYLTGIQLKEICSFKGSLPTFKKCTKYKNFIIWRGGELIYAYGAVSKDLPGMLFQLADAGYSSPLSIACPFGTPMVSSYQGTSYKLSKFSGYETNSFWKSIMFPIGKCTITDMEVYCDTLGTGARADFTITYDRGSGFNTTELILDETNIRRKVFPIGQKIENDFRVEVSFANGSTTNPVKINRIVINVLIDE